MGDLMLKDFGFEMCVCNGGDVLVWLWLCCDEIV